MDIRKVFSISGRIGRGDYSVISVALLLFVLGVRRIARNTAETLGGTDIELYGERAGGAGYAHDGWLDLALIGIALMVWTPATIKRDHDLFDPRDTSWFVGLLLIPPVLIVMMPILLLVSGNSTRTRFGEPHSGSPFPGLHGKREEVGE